MILDNVRLPYSNRVIDIRITGSLITEISEAALINNNDAFKLAFDNAIAFPGLINSHDHLDFNLFPQLGCSTYNNYTEWANNIHENYKDDINSVLKIPEDLRIKWG